MTSNPIRLVRAAALTVAMAGGAATAIAACSFDRSTGPQYSYGTDNPFADARAAVSILTTASGASVVTLRVRNVDADPGRTFGAHIHQFACGDSGTVAGPHYLHAGLDPALPLEQREVWLDVTVNAAGNGHAVALRPWIVDQSSQRSVILHADPTAADGTAGARLACIDLDGD